MTIVGMMQMSTYQIVEMVAVRHGFMSAAWTVPMIAIVTVTLVAVRAVLRIG